MMKKSFTNSYIILILALSLFACGGDDTEDMNADEEEQEVELIKEGTGVTDVEGNSYRTVIVGDQEWMADNLRTSKYANGDDIPNITDPTEWNNYFGDAWSSYDNDPSKDNPHGKLYTWYAAADTRNLCPAGWHIPSDAEWTSLIVGLDSLTNPVANGAQSTSAGGRMKSTGTIENGDGLWAQPNTGALNDSKFNSVPSGTRSLAGYFANITTYSYWWSSTEEDSDRAWGRIILNNEASIYRGTTYKKDGRACRCKKN